MTGESLTGPDPVPEASDGDGYLGGSAPDEAAREATLDDLDAIVGIAQFCLDEQREGRGGAIWAVRETRPPPFELSLRQAIHDPDHALFVGTIDEVVVGYAAVRIEHLRSGDLLGVVDDLVVLAGARGIGVGEAMIRLVIAFCDSRRCVGIDSLALPGNRATKNFFETFGFKARLLTVHRQLRPT